MKLFKYFLFGILITLVSSCRNEGEELISPYHRSYETHADKFDAFWHIMNETYVFWDVDSTDWDEVYRSYMPKFKALDELPQEEVNPDSLLSLYNGACKNLTDHHFYLIYTFGVNDENRPQQWGCSPGPREVKSRSYYHPRMNPSLKADCIDHLEAEGRVQDKLRVESKEQDLRYTFCNIDNGIAYLSLSAFDWISENNPAGAEALDRLFTSYFKKLSSESLKGVIIDVRDNGGGYTSFQAFVYGPLLNEPLHIGYTHQKNGTGRLDYTPWMPLHVNATSKEELEMPENIEINVPIVVLANVNSASMSEMTALTAKADPRGVVIGERTFGGNGLLSNNHIFEFAGPWNNLGNFFNNIYSCTCAIVDLDYTSHEGKGIEPDIEVLHDEEAMSHGIDVQLNRAIEYIHNGH